MLTACMQLQVRGPLTALRTLGSILVPRLRQKEGQEIDRDVAQGILTQACASHYTHDSFQSGFSPTCLIVLPITSGNYGHKGQIICKRK